MSTATIGVDLANKEWETDSGQEAGVQFTIEGRAALDV